MSQTLQEQEIKRSELQETLKELAEPFQPSDHETVVKNFGHYQKELTYVAVPSVIRRCNAKLLGRGSLRFIVLTPMNERFRGDDILVDCRLSFVAKDGQEIAYDQCGGGKVTRAESDILMGKQITVKRGDPIDLGFDMKAAISDAFKKCCTFFGIGLYLYEKEYYLKSSPKPESLPENGHRVISPEPSGPVLVITPVKKDVPVKVDPPRKINSLQINAITVMSQVKEGFDLQKVLALGNVKSLEELTNDQAAKMIDELNKLPMKKK